ncbi:RidA family protein [Novacetimonas hansenii]|uniref:RidA family protein n=1 Tax=Novacetimonas hansenii TaxID=436 RepID=UPI00248D492A|nr:endoribonuclease L-PSP [Novacetimonas hansenii]
MKETTRPNEDIHIRHLTGQDLATGQFAPTMLGQFRHALAQGADILEQHGSSLHDVTRMVVTLTKTDEFASCFTTLNEAFGRTCPAMTFRLVKKHQHAPQLIELDLLVAIPDASLCGI